MRIPRLFFYLLVILILPSYSEVQNGLQEGPSPPKSPAEEAKTFRVEPGFQVQLVAAEPLVQDPVVITFDEDGRLWVVEMRGFMPDIDGNGEEQPLGRISILEDLDADGTMDKSTLYLDSLILPRALGLVKGGALVAENHALWLTQDLDGDLMADRKVLLDATYARIGSPEHTDNGLLRNVDNWYYSAKSRLRYRLQNGQWVRDSTEARGQWGISHDEQGRLFYNYNWSQLHADLVPPNYLFRNKHHLPSTGIDHGLTIDRKVFPIRPNPAVNRGYIPGTLDAEGKLLEFTAACSPLVFQSTLFPQAYRGNVFVCEPAGNLIKRNVVKEVGIELQAYDPNPGREFMASTDERFRPVHTAVGPDGALYVADMYRGLIQHGSYVTPYLREQTLQRQLVLPIQRGRIWRIVPEGWVPTRAPRLSQASTPALVERLAHADGWHRNTAQRLLVERNDPAVGGTLRKVVQSGSSELGRFHALWTLEGLGWLEPELLFGLLTDRSVLLQTTALRLLENPARHDPATRIRLEEKMLTLAQRASARQALQLALSAQVLSPEAATTILIKLVTDHGELPLIRDAVLSSLEHREFSLLQTIWTAKAWETADPAKEIFLEMLTAAIMKKGDSQELRALLALLTTPEPTTDWKEKVVLTGMAIQAGNSTAMGKISLESEPLLFKKNNLPLDGGRLERLKRLFSWPGYSPDTSSVAVATLSQEALRQFALGRQKYLVTCVGCHGSDGAGVSRLGPPLSRSEWVLGDDRRLSLIVLHGLEGPLEVAGKQYDAPEILPVMPAHSTLDDAGIAAILTYIRNEWGNQAPAVSGRTVATTRHTTQGRVYPWNAPELNKHMETLPLPTKP
ncbi:hypothetical protein GCM10027275_32790 [Rhabdobacter roseus]|uniref:Mono/diheme cytochrome c family protein/glucose/arabinose dehydrogenase n=1 Tax=Rhabdobacter roseus TaxID=1655419 RepID=A0A840U0V0_9BACT|nr:c-type cytochrome [Rhabdobacter roseus]MBB5285499.1 mono/diheme cytochrome c family protein/glucose/arabinose dehydrogenase [Rhabdobacter roseus]